MTSTTILIKFKKQLCSFFDEIIEQFPEESDFIVAKMFVSNQIPIKDAMEGFNSFMSSDDNKIKSMVKERNEKFFIDESPFSFMSRDRNDKLSEIWRSGRLDDEDKEVIWNWVDSFISIGEKYIASIETS